MVSFDLRIRMDSQNNDQIYSNQTVLSSTGEYVSSATDSGLISSMTTPLNSSSTLQNSQETGTFSESSSFELPSPIDGPGHPTTTESSISTVSGISSKLLLTRSSSENSVNYYYVSSTSDDASPAATIPSTTTSDFTSYTDGPVRTVADTDLDEEQSTACSTGITPCTSTSATDYYTTGYSYTQEFVVTDSASSFTTFVVLETETPLEYGSTLTTTALQPAITTDPDSFQKYMDLHASSTSDASSPSTLGKNAIVGISVGTVLGCLISLLLLFFFCRRRRQKRSFVVNRNTKPNNQDSYNPAEKGLSMGTSKEFLVNEKSTARSSNNRNVTNYSSISNDEITPSTTRNEDIELGLSSMKSVLLSSNSPPPSPTTSEFFTFPTSVPMPPLPRKMAPSAANPQNERQMHVLYEKSEENSLSSLRHSRESSTVSANPALQRPESHNEEEYHYEDAFKDYQSHSPFTNNLQSPLPGNTLLSTSPKTPMSKNSNSLYTSSPTSSKKPSRYSAIADNLNLFKANYNNHEPTSHILLSTGGKTRAQAGLTPTPPRPRKSNASKQGADGNVERHPSNGSDVVDTLSSFTLMNGKLRSTGRHHGSDGCENGNNNDSDSSYSFDSDVSVGSV